MTFPNTTMNSDTNTHTAAAYYTNLVAGAADAGHTHVINVGVNTASFYSANYINWSNGNNTNRTFRSHDHVNNANYNSASAAEGNHSHANSATLGTINFTQTETAHTHNASPSAGALTSLSLTGSSDPQNIIMNYIIKV
jgi:hypothetical protein